MLNAAGAWSRNSWDGISWSCIRDVSISFCREPGYTLQYHSPAIINNCCWTHELLIAFRQNCTNRFHTATRRCQETACSVLFRQPGSFFCTRRHLYSTAQCMPQEWSNYSAELRAWGTAWLILTARLSSGTTMGVHEYREVIWRHVWGTRGCIFIPSSHLIFVFFPSLLFYLLFLPAFILFLSFVIFHFRFLPSSSSLSFIQFSFSFTLFSTLILSFLHPVSSHLHYSFYFLCSFLCNIFFFLLVSVFLSIYILFAIIALFFPPLVLFFHVSSHDSPLLSRVYSTYKQRYRSGRRFNKTCMPAQICDRIIRIITIGQN